MLETVNTKTDGKVGLEKDEPERIIITYQKRKKPTNQPNTIRRADKTHSKTSNFNRETCNSLIEHGGEIDGWEMDG